MGWANRHVCWLARGLRIGDGARLDHHLEGVLYGALPLPLLPTLQAFQSPWFSSMHALGVLGRGATGRYGALPLPLLPTLQAFQSPWFSSMHEFGVVGRD